MVGCGCFGPPATAGTLAAIEAATSCGRVRGGEGRSQGTLYKSLVACKTPLFGTIRSTFTVLPVPCVNAETFR
eukprot:766894-Hanusia_phi.AAC.4